jgi:small-conductance mechanosensitive channel
MNDFQHWLTTTTFLGIPLHNWAFALVAALASHLVLTTVLRLARTRLHAGAQAAPAVSGVAAVRPMLAQMLERTSGTLLMVAAVLVGLNVLDLPPRWSGRVAQLWYVTVALQIALWGAKLIELAMHNYLLRQSAPGSTPQASVSSTLIGWGLNTALWTIVALAVLSNLGFNITAFVASLGIGGIAVALAAQNILGDLFASIAIALDKPFEVGDAVNNGSVAGTVEHVGLKTTRVRSLAGEQIVVSNTEMLKGSLRNFKRMQTRRIEFKFGVTYDTTPEQAEAIPGLVQRVVEAQPQLVFDRAHLAGLGESSLDYVVVYVMQTADYKLYMDNQQAIYIGLMRELAAMGVQFAFPTRTLVLAPGVVGGAEPGLRYVTDDHPAHRPTT